MCEVKTLQNILHETSNDQENLVILVLEGTQFLRFGALTLRKDRRQVVPLGGSFTYFKSKNTPSSI